MGVYMICKSGGLNFKVRIFMGSNLSLWVWGFGGPPPRKFRNMKCSRSDSGPT